MSVFTAEMTPFGRRFDLQDKEANVGGLKTGAVKSTIKTYCIKYYLYGLILSLLKSDITCTKLSKVQVSHIYLHVQY